MESVKRWNIEVGISPEIRKRIAEKQRGRKLSEEAKQKISEANKGKPAWNKGLTIKDPRVKKNVKNRTKTFLKLYAEGKIKPWNKGKPWPNEVKQKISLRKKGKTYEEIMGKEKALELKKKLSKIMTIRMLGKNNPMYGKHGDQNPHFGKPAQHGKHSFKKDLGHHCRSKWEANYIRYLLWKKQKYEYEPKTFVIKLPNGINATYTPDFLVNDKIWVELKGWKNRSKIKKWELFQQQYPHKKFALVDRKKYKSIERLFKFIIPNWES